jgi:hypothetical protein
MITLPVYEGLTANDDSLNRAFINMQAQINALSAGGGGPPGGIDGSLQFRSGSGFSGDANLTWDGSLLEVTGQGEFIATAPDTIGSNLDTLHAEADSASGGTQNVGVLRAANFGVVHLGSHTVDQAIGASAAVTNFSSGTINNAYGLYVFGTVNAGGTLTTNYGIFVEDQQAGATNFAIKTGVGPISLGDTVTLADAKNLVVGTGTGTEIATATGQKLGFWGTTPVVQQVLATGAGHTVDQVITFLQLVGLCKQS